MGGSPKTPKPSDEQREMERLQKEMLKLQLEQAKNPIKLPELKLPPPPPPPPPPAMQASADVVQAARDARRRALNRTNAGRGTIFAGETKTLLG